MAGACWGLEGIPNEWRAGVANSASLHLRATHLAELSQKHQDRILASANKKQEITEDHQQHTKEEEEGEKERTSSSRPKKEDNDVTLVCVDEDVSSSDDERDTDIDSNGRYSEEEEKKEEGLNQSSEGVVQVDPLSLAALVRMERDPVVHSMVMTPSSPPASSGHKH